VGLGVAIAAQRLRQAAVVEARGMAQRQHFEALIA
jgi:hypothetical protein